MLDPASVTSVQPGEQATLIIANLPPNHKAVWLNSDQTLELYASENNHFQPQISQNAPTVSNTAGQSATCVFQVWINGGCGH